MPTGSFSQSVVFHRWNFGFVGWIRIDKFYIWIVIVDFGQPTGGKAGTQFISAAQNGNLTFQAKFINFLMQFIELFNVYPFCG